MKLKRIKVKNFRLLRDVEIVLEDGVTLIVGRNNSGKTSLSEILQRFTSDKRLPFKIQDFSTACYDEFCSALSSWQATADEEETRTVLPYIELRLYVEYDPAQPLGSLGEFVIDLDMDCREALIVARFELADGAIASLFEEAPEGGVTEDNCAVFFRNLSERIEKHFVIKSWAEDPNDPENRKPTKLSTVKAVLQTGFINAQRGLDDVSGRESHVLAKVLEALFSTASMESAAEEQKQIASRLEDAVSSIQEGIDKDFRENLDKLLPTLQALGYPGLGGPELTTETTLDVKRLLSDHTSVRYKGHSGVLLPESYNGLGMRNLIFILLQIFSFYREFRAEPGATDLHLVFIEEPEAHLHPQMQEVFIRQILEIVALLNKQHADEPPWPVQFVVSTHSSHIANEAHFETIRYFLPCAEDAEKGLWRTRIKDLRTDLAISEPDKKFLRQYLTLTRCDLFFADKAVLIEGTSERLLLPAIITKLDEGRPQKDQLGSQYLAVMEVGGAYAHKFFKLLDFLELRSLIITDLDPVEKAGGKKCTVRQAKATSNACLKDWFGKTREPLELAGLADDEKIKDIVRIAFQQPEEKDGACGRTLEDAFILANPAKFAAVGSTVEELEVSARDLAEAEKKSAFALTYAIDDQDWEIPRYVRDGLLWLSQGHGSPPAVIAPPAAVVAEIAAVNPEKDAGDAG